jgi:hypothetical protein
VGVFQVVGFQSGLKKGHIALFKEARRQQLARRLRAILNFIPGPQGITWPSGVKFVP